MLFARLDSVRCGQRCLEMDSDRLARQVGFSAAVILLIAAAFRLLAQAESFLDQGEFLSPAVGEGGLFDGLGAGLVQRRSGARPWPSSPSLGPAVIRAGGRAARVDDAAAHGSCHGSAERADCRRDAARAACVCGRALAWHARRGALRLEAVGPAGALRTPARPPRTAHWEVLTPGADIGVRRSSPPAAPRRCGWSAAFARSARRRTASGSC